MAPPSTLPSVDQARAILLAAVRPLTAVDVPVAGALGLTLAEPVVAAHDVPPFPASAMDGYAVQACGAGRRLQLIGESRAGAPFAGTLGAGEAVRISTGAALPRGADGVLQLERVETTPEHVVLGEPVDAGRNVRDAGEDLLAGATVLETGTRLGPAEIGAAIGAGCTTLRCIPRARVAVIATGDELVAPGTPLGPGQIHESNGATLAALAERCGAAVTLRTHAADHAGAIREAAAEGLASADVLVLSGGVSAGPHDQVKPALAQLGVRELQWGVAVRPGRPTWLGERDGALVLGLPGNPVSAYATFLLFARPAIAALQGSGAPPARAPLAVPVSRHPGRDECVRVRREPGGAVVPVGGRHSHELASLVGVDALAIVPRGEGDVAAGTEVVVEPL